MAITKEQMKYVYMVAIAIAVIYAVYHSQTLTDLVMKKEPLIPE